MEPRDVVVVGGSAGSLEPLRELTAALPADLPASVLVTQHVAEDAQSELPWLLSRAGPLMAGHAEEGERLQAGRVYVAPPGCHLLMPDGVVELSNGPKINHTRPAVDAMFASAARWFGDRVVAVVLSGLRDDGAVGARCPRLLACLICACRAFLQRRRLGLRLDPGGQLTRASPIGRWPADRFAGCSPVSGSRSWRWWPRS